MAKDMRRGSGDDIRKCSGAVSVWLVKRMKVEG